MLQYETDHRASQSYAPPRSAVRGPGGSAVVEESGRLLGEARLDAVDKHDLRVRLAVGLYDPAKLADGIAHERLGARSCRGLSYAFHNDCAVVASKVDVEIYTVRGERRNACAVRPVLETDNPKVRKTLQRTRQAGLFPACQCRKLALPRSACAAGLHRRAVPCPSSGRCQWS